jgi:hypothetical protein
MKKLIKGYYLSRDIALQSIENSSKKNSCAWFIVGQAKTHRSGIDRCLTTSPGISAIHN